MYQGTVLEANVSIDQHICEDMHFVLFSFVERP